MKLNLGLSVSIGGSHSESFQLKVCALEEIVFLILWLLSWISRECKSAGKRRWRRIWGWGRSSSSGSDSDNNFKSSFFFTWTTGMQRRWSVSMMHLPPLCSTNHHPVPYGLKRLFFSYIFNCKSPSFKVFHLFPCLLIFWRENCTVLLLWVRS